MCAPLWRSNSLGGDVYSPAVAGGRVFVVSRGDRIQALDATGATGCSGTPKTCPTLWVTPLHNDPVSTATVVNGLVYVEETDLTATVFALDAATGAHVWDSVPEDRSTGFTKQSGAVAVANGVAYATMSDLVSSDGEGLYAFDPTGNTELLRHQPEVVRAVVGGELRLLHRQRHVACGRGRSRVRRRHQRPPPRV